MFVCSNTIQKLSTMGRYKNITFKRKKYWLIAIVYKNKNFKNKNFYCPIEGPEGAKSLQWFIKK
jgi:hypothetical protein